MSEAEIIARTAGTPPATRASLANDLRALGVKPGHTLLVHSSLSSLGWVVGGPVAVIQALEDVLTSEGTLVMPAHSSDLSDPKDWQNPPVPEAWWPVIRDAMPVFEPDLTPTRGMGAIAEAFRKQEGVLRSRHPQASFCAWGKHREAVTADHSLEFCLGEHSPLALAYDHGAWVLLLGVGHESNTSLHLAEVRAHAEGKVTYPNGMPVVEHGIRRWATFTELAFQSDDFPTIGTAFEALGTTTMGQVGQTTARLFSQRALVDFAVRWMEANRHHRS